MRKERVDGDASGQKLLEELNEETIMEMDDDIETVSLHRAGDMGEVRELFDGVRAPMNPDQQKLICTQYKESVRQIYPTVDDKITLVPTTAALG